MRIKAIRQCNSSHLVFTTQIRMMIFLCSALFAFMLFSCGSDSDDCDETHYYYNPNLQTITSAVTPIDSSDVGKTAYLIVCNLSGENTPAANSGGVLVSVCGAYNSVLTAMARKVDALVAQNKRSGKILKTVYSARNKFDGHSVGDMVSDVWVIPGYALMDGTERQEKRTFTLKVSGDVCNIWLCESSSVTVNNDTLQSIANKADEAFPAEMKIFGGRNMNSTTEYITTPEKFNIFIYDFYGNNQTYSRSEGFFYYPDLYTEEAIASEEYHSNATQCVYIDSRMVNDTNWVLSAAIAHEGQHMLGYINKVINNGIYRQNNYTWYTEMLSIMAQDLMSEHIGTSDTDNAYGYFVTNTNGFNSNTWAGFYSWEGTIANYGAAYSFISYLARHYGNDTPASFVKEVANNRATGIDSVERAIRAFGSSDTFCDAIVDWARYCLTESPFRQVNESIDGVQFTMHSVYVAPPILENIGVSCSLGAYGFYIVKLGVMHSGDVIRTKMDGNGAGIRMFALYASH